MEHDESELSPAIKGAVYTIGALVFAGLIVYGVLSTFHVVTQLIAG